MDEVDGSLQLGDVEGDVGGVLVVWAKERHEVGEAALHTTLSILCDTTLCSVHKLVGNIGTSTLRVWLLALCLRMMDDALNRPDGKLPLSRSLGAESGTAASTQRHHHIAIARARHRGICLPLAQRPFIRLYPHSGAVRPHHRASGPPRWRGPWGGPASHQRRYIQFGGSVVPPTNSTQYYPILPTNFCTEIGLWVYSTA